MWKNMVNVEKYGKMLKIWKNMELYGKMWNNMRKWKVWIKCKIWKIW